MVIGAVFHGSARRNKHEIDYLGAIYLSMALLCIILFTTEGGTIRQWNDPQLWCILAFGLTGIAGFIYEERLARGQSFRSRCSAIAAFCSAA